MQKILPIIFLLIVLLTGCSTIPEEAAQAENGTLNMESWNVKDQKIIRLDGEWEFYWNKLVGMNDLGIIKPDLNVAVPSSWDSYSVNHKRLNGTGYGTYRLHVKTSLPKDTMLGLRVYTFSSAYRLYIDETLVSSSGTVGVNAAEERGEYQPKVVFFNVPSNDFDIIIQVSNFTYDRGGFWYSIFMGNPDKIIRLHDRYMAKEISVLGALFVISLFFLAIYMLRKELRYALYFACLCFTLAVSVDMVGQFLLVRLIPGLSFKFIILLWYSFTTWLLFFLILFINELFKSRFSEIVVKIYFGISVILQILFITTPTTFYTKLAYISNCFDIAGALCSVIIVAIGIKNGNRDGWLNIASMVIALITYIHDDLYWTNVINSEYGEFSYIGLFLFILLQMMIQANRIRHFQDQKVAAELRFLQAQIKPHFLFNALNTFNSLSIYDIEKARELLTDFSNYLRRSFSFKDINQFAPLKNEVELAKAYTKIEKARFEERLDVDFKVSNDTDVNIPILILQPVIENAIIHGVLPKPEGGRVEVTVREEDRMLTFSVKDNGIGMSREKTRDILKHKGDGVGLSNINNRLIKLYGKGLSIYSEPSVGTEVSWRVPIENRRKKTI